MRFARGIAPAPIGVGRRHLRRALIVYYQLLGPPGSHCNPAYRGVYRPGPAYEESLPDTAPANRAWDTYASHEERLPTRELALTLAAAFRTAGRDYEVVRVERADEPTGGDGAGKLGYDVAQAGWYSLLSWGLHWNGAVPAAPPPMGPLLRLIEAHFRPLLNEHVLFDSWEDARFFLDVVQSLSSLAPGTWEAPGHEEFEIYRLVRIQPVPAS
jgi:hypothetical protein